jgi:hypothetical protein
MASATPAASVRGKSTSAPEDKGIRGFKLLSGVADGVIEAEISTQLFNFWEKLGPPHNTYNVEIARFCNRDQAARDLGICCV